LNYFLYILLSLLNLVGHLFFNDFKELIANKNLTENTKLMSNITILSDPNSPDQNLEFLKKFNYQDLTKLIIETKGKNNKPLNYYEEYLKENILISNLLDISLMAVLSALAIAIVINLTIVPVPWVIEPICLIIATVVVAINREKVEPNLDKKAENYININGATNVACYGDQYNEYNNQSWFRIQPV
jgi:hypothetical protein